MEKPKGSDVIAEFFVTLNFIEPLSSIPFHPHMSLFESPFLAVPAGDWLSSNELAFAIFDGFPVSPGHVLVTTRRIVETWFDATDEEQSALMALVKESKRLLDIQLFPKPDGYNVGFNSGGPPAKPCHMSTSM